MRLKYSLKIFYFTKTSPYILHGKWKEKCFYQASTSFHVWGCQMSSLMHTLFLYTVEKMQMIWKQTYVSWSLTISIVIFCSNKRVIQPVCVPSWAVVLFVVAKSVIKHSQGWTVINPNMDHQCGCRINALMRPLSDNTKSVVLIEKHWQQVKLQIMLM